MTKLEQQGFAHADAVLAVVESCSKGVMRSIIAQAYVAGAKASQKQELKPRNPDQDVLSVLDFLNEQTGRKFRYSSANVSIIKARLKEQDVTLNGVLKMIERQCEKWNGTDMEEYLRPSTLFRASKFDSYYSARDLPVNPGQKKNRRFGTLNYDES